MSLNLRVTQRSIADRSLQGLQGNLDRLQQIQERLSSGKEINRPSDSPVGTVSAMQLRSEQSRLTQYGRNSQDGLGWLGTADNALTSMLGDIRRLRELAVQGISGGQDQQSRTAMAAEADALRSDLLAVANSRYLGRPIFAGTANTTNAYDAAGNYLGDTGIVQRTVATNTTVDVSVPGTVVFGPAGNDLFAVAAGVVNDLQTNPGNLSARLGQLDASMQSVQNQLAAVGARYNRVDTMRQLNDDRGTAITATLGEVEGVDIPKTIMELQLQQVAYQSALGATAKVITPTLMDFLK